MAASRQKLSGAYFTPEDVARALVNWAVRDTSDRLLDPSCGDGRVLAAHPFSVGVEQDAAAAAAARDRVPGAIVHPGDFFSWAASTDERFECAAGNPPFIRYQTFSGEVRKRAQTLCATLGAKFSGLASSWAPFLVAAASLLKPGGRMAFVVPAEIGHAPYATPLLDYLIAKFTRVQVVAIRHKLFPNLSEDCWLLLADGAGGRTNEIAFTAVERFDPFTFDALPTQVISAKEWREVWRSRLRPYLLPQSSRELYQATAGRSRSKRLSDVAAIGIGYVSGANDFFHLRPSTASRFGIHERYLQPAVRNGRALPARTLTSDAVQGWIQSDDPILLLRMGKTDEVPPSVQRYLDTEAGYAARTAYKCRVRTPWWSVPDVSAPDLFLTYLSGETPNLVRNAAGCVCTNTLHAVRLKLGVNPMQLVDSFAAPFTKLSCELEGHPLGGGLLKIEPGEAAQIVVTGGGLGAQDASLVSEAITTMRRWRHYER